MEVGENREKLLQDMREGKGEGELWEDGRESQEE